MIAILEWIDGFGNDTYVKGIYPNFEQAEQAHLADEYSKGDRWQEFEYGSVAFDWYEANNFPKKKNKRK